MKKKLLVLEDDFVLASEWQEQIEQSGLYHVVVATSGNEALAFAEREAYDAFVLDLFFVKGGDFAPDGGLHIIGKVREITGADTPIICITGYITEPRQVDSLEGAVLHLGGDVLLKKPVNVDTILGELTSRQ